MTRAEDVDAAIERASRGLRVASDPYWAEVDADDRLLAEEVVRLREALEDVLNQSCNISGEVDSMALSAYADAMRLLAEHGRLTITHEVGRRVIGRWRQP